MSITLPPKGLPPVLREGQWLRSTISGAEWADQTGAIVTGTWNWNVSTTTVNAGDVALNTTAWNTATEIHLSEHNKAGADTTNALVAIQPNDTIYIQDKADSTKWGRYKVTTAGVDMGTWMKFAVSFIEGGGTVPANNRDTTVSVAKAGGGSGGSGLPADVINPANTRLVSDFLTATDTQPAFRIMGDGRIQWGIGATTAPDVILGRIMQRLPTLSVTAPAGKSAMFNVVDPADNSAAWISVDGGWPYLSLESGQAVATPASGTGIAFQAGANNSKSDWEIYTQGDHDGLIFYANMFGDKYRLGSDGLSLGTGKLQFGTGPFEGASDTNLYRASAGILKTDGAFQVSGYLAVDVAGAGNPIYFGSAFDAYLQRTGPGVLKTGGIFNAVGGLQINGVNVSVGGGNIAYGTSFPVSPTDGQAYGYVADATNGVIWYFVWNASAGKWRFVGGPPLAANVATSEQMSSASYGDLTTVGPSITLPFAGDYDIGVQFRGAGQQSDVARMAYTIGATAAADNDAASVAPMPLGPQIVAAGRINSAGGIVSGFGGFTNVKTGAGNHTITLPAAYTNPVMLVTVFGQSVVIGGAQITSTTYNVYITTPSAWTDADFYFAIYAAAPPLAANQESRGTVWQRKAGISGTVTAKYRTGGALGTFTNRWLFVRPVQK